MSNPDKNDDTFSTMREIGHDTGLTSHQVGKALLDAGYRTEDGQPSDLAKQQHVVKPYTIYNNGKKAYRWLESKVRPIAEAWKTKNLAPKGSKVS
jgi:hypothetical protein